MKDKLIVSRRVAVSTLAFGVLSVSVPNLIYAKRPGHDPRNEPGCSDVPDRYPAISDDLVSEVVGVSHFDLDRLKELVEPRPELARATWDWGFGDWESAIGAASHVGRRDIVEYLMHKGARPTLFTIAMMGDFQSIKSAVSFFPDVQKIAGPHGITILQHAQIGSRNEDLDDSQRDNFKQLIEFLEAKGDADLRQTDKAMSPAEKEKYLGDYKYGDGGGDGFSVRLNMRKMLALGKLGSFGGGLFYQGKHRFEYNGVRSVQVAFEFNGEQVVALTVKDPDSEIRAVKVQTESDG